MARYLLQWALVTARMPDNPKEIATGWKQLMQLVHKDLEQGTLKDWGAFPGDHGGYCIAEGDPITIMAFTTQYAPFVEFTVHPVASIKEVDEFLNKIV